MPCHRTTHRCTLFLGLVGHYRRFIKGLCMLHSPLVSILPETCPVRSQSWCHLLRMPWRPLRHWNRHAWQHPFWCSLTTPSHSCWRPMHPVLLQNQADGCYHPTVYGSRALTSHEKNYHSTKLAFLVLKWAVTEHFKEYLPYQSFVVCTDNNPLMHIMPTLNLDNMGHWWVGALMQFNIELEYQKGCDNMVADVLSWFTTQLDPKTVKSILDGVPQSWWKVTNTSNKKYKLLQASHWWRCILPMVPKPRERTQCWPQCCTGWRHRSRQIWRCFWKNTPPVQKVNSSYGIDRISQFIRGTCTSA